MTFVADSDRAGYAVVLERNLREVADELRTVDVIELVGFVQAEGYSAIEDLLQSCTELFFRDGTLTFGWSGSATLAWDDLPSVTVGMEFQNGGVSVFFDLTLSAFDATVAVGGILFEDDPGQASARLDRLAEAVSDARLPLRTATR